MDLYPRQSTDNTDIPSGWTGYIVKWSIVGGLIFLVALYLLLAYIHAQRRVRKGLRPPRYHYTPITATHKPTSRPTMEHPPEAAPPPAYGMHPMPPPPVYQSKVDPAQGQAHFSQGFQPPPGPPPGRTE
ncbi:uncharacterized protein DNG_04791 [Cephalotrichum gorgonifer]|uniref:Uncharacterized protein n=1 Tax=Cephalotrichum gorgonifer TaxID=2041049 RepID=A0AAE8MXY0_9PEZI|nr:uncharacterized protein DNG_04791 [Cephalotrichum gorgonifer]